MPLFLHFGCNRQVNLVDSALDDVWKVERTIVTHASLGHLIQGTAHLSEELRMLVMVLKETIHAS